MKRQFSNGIGHYVFGWVSKNKLLTVFALVAFICLAFTMNTFAGAMILATGPLAGFTEEQAEALIAKIKSENAEIAEKAATKARTEFEASLKGYATSEDLAKLTNEEIVGLKEELAKMGLKHADITAIQVKQGETLTGLKETQVVVQRKAKNTPNTFKERTAALLEHLFKSEDFKKFEANGYVGGTEKYGILQDGTIKSSLELDELRQKAVSVTSNHTGVVELTEFVGNVRDVPMRKTHIRNLMTVRPTSAAQIVAPEVYDYTDAMTQGLIMLAENTEASLSVFKTKENTWTLKRIARAMEVSKRYFKTNGLSWVMSWILNRLPDQMQNVEDFQILFGDGAGNNISGIVKSAQSLTLSGSFIATNFLSIATYNAGTETLVTMAATVPHGLKSGDLITFAATTGGTYDHEYTIKVVDSYSFLVNRAYAADVNVAANWTATWTNYWYHAIDNAQEFDVLSVAKAYLNAGEYEATGVILHANSAEKLGLIKDLDAAYIGISRDAMGRMNISSMPIAVSNAMPAGSFLVGDFQRAIEIAEYTPLTIQISEDTTDKKKNQVTVIAEEELIVPIYNPYWFVYGTFAAAITALEKP
jgi:HK97 family phage major capsid protein